MEMLSTLFFVAATVGLAALLIQRVAVARFFARPVGRQPMALPGISILKPLCGLDEALEETLSTFAALEYPTYEVVLGVKDGSDPAFAVARRVAAQCPLRFRVELQQSSPGLNPKVNQLVTLARAARHDLLVVSDSNARLNPLALRELATLFAADEGIGCVTSPVSGARHESLGATLDNLHLASAIGAGQIAAKQVSDKDLVVGKSMALRRDVLEALGGFSAFANVLAEDYAIGQALRSTGFRTAVATLPVHNIAVRRTVMSFFRRYVRWAVIHRTAISLPTYLGQALLNPWPLAVIALLFDPSFEACWAASGVFGLKVLIDVSAARALGCQVSPAAAVAAVLVKDALLFVAWCNGLFARTVDWRGNRLRVGHGSQLLVPAELRAELYASTPSGAP